MENSKPIKRIRHGKISLAVWENQGPEGAFYSYTVQRSVPKQGESGFDNYTSFGRWDSRNLMRCILDFDAFVDAKEREAQKETEQSAAA